MSRSKFALGRFRFLVGERWTDLASQIRTIEESREIRAWMGHTTRDVGRQAPSGTESKNEVAQSDYYL
jgi:hypothetical protein